MAVWDGIPLPSFLGLERFLIQIEFHAHISCSDILQRLSEQNLR